jgi:hypothetical protein
VPAQHHFAQTLVDPGITAVTEQLVGITARAKAHSALLTISSTTPLTCDADKKTQRMSHAYSQEDKPKSNYLRLQPLRRRTSRHLS